jgi:hypothetical protein
VLVAAIDWTKWSAIGSLVAAVATVLVAMVTLGLVIVTRGIVNATKKGLKDESPTPARASSCSTSPRLDPDLLQARNRRRQVSPSQRLAGRGRWPLKRIDACAYRAA